MCEAAELPQQGNSAFVHEHHHAEADVRLNQAMVQSMVAQVLMPWYPDRVLFGTDLGVELDDS